MLARLAARLTYANVVSSLCMFMVIGGGAYAATALPRNSVGRNQLKHDAVTSWKVKDHTLTAADIKNGTIGTGALANGTIPGRQTVTVRPGNAAPPGKNGSGPNCVDGVPGGSKGYKAADGVTQNSCGGGAGGQSTLTASCLPGEVAVGGGYDMDKRHALVTKSAPNALTAGTTPTAWVVRVASLTDQDANQTTVTPYVVCLGP